MKDIGLAGVPRSGKSTVFRALTRVGASGARANQAVVSVPDPRLGVLAELEKSRRVVPAQVRFVDVPGGLTPQALGTLRAADALCVVLAGFGAEAAPAAEFEHVKAELLLADLAVVETALDNARRKLKGRSSRAGANEEIDALERAQAALSDEVLVRAAGLEEGDRGRLSGLGLLTAKPWIVVVNMSEGSSLPADAPEGSVPIWAQIEAETAGMPPDEANELLEGFGIVEPGLGRVIQAGYGALDLITFLTTGPDETRAWEIPRGTRAGDAAGVIHTDLQRGFIRAEVVSYEDLVDTGGWDAAKRKGLLRVEGRDYVVREGDVMHVRFAV